MGRPDAGLWLCGDYDGSFSLNCSACQVEYQGVVADMEIRTWKGGASLAEVNEAAASHVHIDAREPVA